MDPITATIIGGLLWFFLGSLAAGVIYGLAFLVTALTIGEDAGAGAATLLVGWLLAAAWELYVIFNVIIHAVRLFQLATGAEVTV